MEMMIGPVTTGGKNLMTLLAPKPFIKADSRRYRSPAQKTPPQAYGSISMLGVPSSMRGATAAYPPRKAKDEPKNAGTFPLVKR